MNDADRMSRSQGVGGLHANFEGVRGGHAAGTHNLTHRASADVLHHNSLALFGTEDFVNGNDVGMVQR